MATTKILTSIHGKRLGLSATGAIVDPNGDVAVVRGDSSQAAEAGSLLRSVVETISSSGATLLSYGLSIISSATGHSAMTLNLGLPPAAGREKEIFCDTSASTITIAATALLAFGSSVGSSALTLSGAAGTRGTTIKLRAADASRWLWMNRVIA